MSLLNPFIKKRLCDLDIREYLKELYLRNISLGNEYAVIEGLQYVYYENDCVLIGFEESFSDNLDIYHNLYIPDYFTRISLTNDSCFDDYSGITLCLGSKVKYISDKCFENNHYIRELYAPGVVEIGKYSFLGSYIKKCVFLDLKVINEYSFCSSFIREISAPKLEKIKQSAFYKCNLKQVKIYGFNNIEIDYMNKS